MLGKCKAATESLCVQREIEGETTKNTSVCGVSSIKVQVPYRGIKVSKGLRVMGTSTSSAVTLLHFFCFTASAFTAFCLCFTQECSDSSEWTEEVVSPVWISWSRRHSLTVTIL